uniref:CUB domain-containing protein n=1 Tax=Panagrellus redivivus TaxID=6233 RepID=A0A7E4VQT4_PANRE
MAAPTTVYHVLCILFFCVITSAYPTAGVQLNNLSSTSTVREKRQLRHNVKGIYLWNRDLPIKYTFNNSLETKVPFIKDLINYMQERTCLNFEYDPQDFTVVFHNTVDGLCRCMAGMNTPFTLMEINYEGCVPRYGISMLLHEFIHLFGAYHVFNEVRSREFISFTDENKADSNYNEMPELRHLGLPFNLGSQINYALSIDTLRPLQQFASFSDAVPVFSDIRMINTFHKCPDLCDPEDLFRCSTNLGLPNSRNCSTCLCPDGFEGPTCTDRIRSSYNNPPCGDTLYATDISQTLHVAIEPSASYVKYRKNSTEIMYPNICVWHIKAPLGKMVSLKVTGKFSYGGPYYVSNQQHLCQQNKLEIKLRNFDLAGIRFCINEDFENIPTLYSDGNLAVVIALSGWLDLPPLDVTFAAVD